MVKNEEFFWYQKYMTLYEKKKHKTMSL